MMNWSDIRAWRKATRERLLAERARIPPAEREAIAARIRARVLALLEERWPAVLGVYWPIHSELDMVPLADAVLERGGRVGLPVVVARGAPLEFWNWRRGLRLVRGQWDIPVPREREPVVPDTCIVPLVGHAGHYRLGYGGGYFDRTLASLQPRPRTIAVGLDSARLETIHPQPHDVAMDVIVTESGVY